MQSLMVVTQTNEENKAIKLSWCIKNCERKAVQVVYITCKAFLVCKSFWKNRQQER